MSTPTGSLMVLDAGDVFGAVRYFNRHYSPRDLRDLNETDLRRAWNLLAAAKAELQAIIPRLERELDYTRAQRETPPP